MHSFDTTLENFADDVIEASKQVPILVDFWAPWCGPCQSLMPVLTSLAEQYAGAFRLAKVNIDEQQPLAQQFAVRSVPTVKLIKQGQVVGEFSGAQPESAIRAFLDKHIERESDRLMNQALQRYESGDKQVIDEMIAIVNSDPGNTTLRLQYVDVLINEEQYDDAKAILDSLPPALRSQAEVATRLTRIEFMNSAEAAGDPESLLETIQAEPDNCQARYALSSIYISQGKFEAALEQLLEIMRVDRQFEDDAGRKGILKVFDMLGGSGELVSRYRQRMASLLY